MKLSTPLWLSLLVLALSCGAPDGSRRAEPTVQPEGWPLEGFWPMNEQEFCSLNEEGVSTAAVMRPRVRGQVVFVHEDLVVVELETPDGMGLSGVVLQVVENGTCLAALTPRLRHPGVVVCDVRPIVEGTTLRVGDRCDSAPRAGAR